VNSKDLQCRGRTITRLQPHATYIWELKKSLLGEGSRVGSKGSYRGIDLIGPKSIRKGFGGVEGQDAVSGAGGKELFGGIWKKILPRL